MVKHVWTTGSTVSRVKDGLVTLERIQTVTPSGQAKLEGRPERYYPEGDLVGQRSKKWSAMPPPYIRVPTESDIQDVRLRNERGRVWTDLCNLCDRLPSYGDLSWEQLQEIESRIVDLKDAMIRRA